MGGCGLDKIDEQSIGGGVTYGQEYLRSDSPHRRLRPFGTSGASSATRPHRQGGTREDLLRRLSSGGEDNEVHQGRDPVVASAERHVLRGHLLPTCAAPAQAVEDEADGVHNRWAPREEGQPQRSLEQGTASSASSQARLRHRHGPTAGLSPRDVGVSRGRDEGGGPDDKMNDDSRVSLRFEPTGRRADSGSSGWVINLSNSHALRAEHLRDGPAENLGGLPEAKPVAPCGPAARDAARSGAAEVAADAINDKMRRQEIEECQARPQKKRRTGGHADSASPTASSTARATSARLANSGGAGGRVEAAVPADPRARSGGPTYGTVSACQSRPVHVPEERLRQLDPGERALRMDTNLSAEGNMGIDASASYVDLSAGTDFKRRRLRGKQPVATDASTLPPIVANSVHAESSGSPSRSFTPSLHRSPHDRDGRPLIAGCSRPPDSGRRHAADG